MQQIIQPKIGATNKRFALFELGFRPFFLLASLFSVISISIWMAVYSLNWPLPVANTTPIAWHGHEMIFGYSFAVIIGFLLTAARNWTGIQTIKGLPLAALALTWLAARTLPLTDSILLAEWAAIFDIVFMSGAIIAVGYPLVKAKQLRQLFIVTILLLLLGANVFYYLGIHNLVNNGISLGLFSGVYLILALIFILARRVMPFFIERGVPYTVQLNNRPWVDMSILIALVCLWAVDVLYKQAELTAFLSLFLALLHSIRLWDWHTKGIWQNPLLWVLFIGYSFFILGFSLKALNFFELYINSLPLHAFTYGGIGMMTIGMMSRVALGHTGRNIMQPPAVLRAVFSLLLIGTVIRVLLPIFLPQLYLIWITTSQACWIVAFALFAYSYSKVLISPRIDGKPG